MKHFAIYEYDVDFNELDVNEAVSAEEEFNTRALETLNKAAGEEVEWEWSGIEVGGLKVLVSAEGAARLAAAGFETGVE